MKVRFTQIIDYWVGVPLCALLSVWALLVRLVFRASPRAPRRVLELLTREKPELTPDTLLIVFSPDQGPALALRGWPIENFAALAKALLERAPSAIIVVMGLPASRGLAQIIIGTARRARCIDLTWKTASLRDVVALFHLSRVLVTADAGPAHMVSRTDIRCVVLFGPEIPRLNAPLGDNMTTLYAHLSCGPCFAAANHRRTICMNDKCIQAIEMHQVLDAVLEGMRGVWADDSARRPA